MVCPKYFSLAAPDLYCCVLTPQLAVTYFFFFFNYPLTLSNRRQVFAIYPFE